MALLSLILILSLGRQRINLVALSLAHGNHDHYDFGITHFVHQPIIGIAQLDFLAVWVA